MIILLIIKYEYNNLDVNMWKPKIKYMYKNIQNIYVTI